MTIRPADLLVYAGGACLQRYGRLWRVTRPADRQGEEAGPTVTRATAGTVIDQDGLLRSVAAGAPRVTWIDGDGDGTREPHLLIEPARTNLCTESEDLTGWTDDGAAATDDQETCGLVNLALVEDDSAIAIEGRYLNTAALTGDGVKAVSCYVKAGTATTSQVLLYDVTAGATRWAVSLAWAAGVPTPTALTGSVLATVALGNGVYRIEGQSTACTAANTHRVWVYPASANVAATGTLYIGGVQVEDAAFPSAYIATDGASASRNADIFTLPYYGGVRSTMSLYARFVEAGTFLSADNAKLVVVGDNGNDTFQLDLDADPGPHYRIGGSNATTSITSGLSEAAAPDIGDLVEIIGWKQADGSVYGTIAINGGAASTSTPSSVLTWLSTFTESEVAIGSRGAADIGAAAFHAVMVAAGLHDLAAFREWLP